MKRKIYVSTLFALFLSVCLSCVAFADSDDDISNTPISGESQIETIVSSTPLRISASDTTGLHSVILSLIGDYNPIQSVTEYRYPSGTGYQTRYQVDVTPDWSWIMTCFLFIVVIFCVFRLIGGIFTGR